MPRAGLSSADVVEAAGTLTDEIGFHELTMGLLAQRLGVRPPSLYKHVENLADLQHRVATAAMVELGDTIRDALQAKAGHDALHAMFSAVRKYVRNHPGRYTSTVGAEFAGPDDPLLAASARVLDSIGAVLRGYGIGESERDHAIRTMRCMIHGFASLSAADAFQWGADPEISFEWMIEFMERGLRGGGTRS
ncbi:MAG TPA: WHG domain-containing protein [Pseudonocardiaceae bacterium]|nr:WHG domain-containing protein [Pseudonocardiaceae bacterium]